MKVRLLVTGKTAMPYLEEGIELFSKRLVHYCDFKKEIIPDVKNAGNLDSSRLIFLESREINKRIKVGDFVILLDEKGKQLSSEAFSSQLNKWMVSGNTNLVFVIGGAFGVDESFRKEVNFVMSLSAMTFSHQMVRLIFLEQLYRAFTILRNEKYHHK